MSLTKNIAAVAISSALVIGAAPAAFAQAGGGDVPTDAKKEGTKEQGPGTTGMSKGEAKGDMKKEGGDMKKDDKM